MFLKRHSSFEAECKENHDRQNTSHAKGSRGDDQLVSYRRLNLMIRVLVGRVASEAITTQEAMAT